MKHLLLSLGFLVSAHSAMACSTPEAQFIGTIATVEKADIYVYITECYYTIKATDYKESAVCPLSQSVAESTQYLDPTCSLKVGDKVSGYITVKDGEVVIDN